jgi:hypothetical protein
MQQFQLSSTIIISLLRKYFFWLITIVISLSLFSCQQLTPYKNKQDLIGNWHCNKIEINTPSHNKVSFEMSTYGSAKITIDKNGLYSFWMDISRDVVLEKEILGNAYSKTIIQAGYTNYRVGFYYATDSSLIVLDADKNKIDEESYSFNERTLTTKFTDKAEKLWKISWVKEN